MVHSDGSGEFIKYFLERCTVCYEISLDLDTWTVSQRRRDSGSQNHSHTQSFHYPYICRSYISLFKTLSPHTVKPIWKVVSPYKSLQNSLCNLFVFPRIQVQSRFFNDSFPSFTCRRIPLFFVRLYDPLKRRWFRLIHSSYGVGLR